MVEIIGIDTVFPGIDYVTLRGGQVIGIDKEQVCLYHSQEAADKSDSTECMNRHIKNPEMDDKIHEAVDYASNLFWGEVAGRFGQIKSGDLAPEHDIRFKEEMLKVVKAWLRTNGGDDYAHLS